MSDHEWCRDVSRDEAVRAAEDAAAVPAIQHRDLPEQVALLWASVGDLIGRVVRLEGEMDAGQDEEAAPAACDSVPPAEGLRTEGWMTAEEREAVKWLSELDKPQYLDVPRKHARVAQALLARSTPPRVKGPTGWAYDAHDMAWIAAIRAAGGEVEG